MLGNAEQSLSLATNCLASRSGTLSALALRTTGSNSEAAATGLSVPEFSDGLYATGPGIVDRRVKGEAPEREHRGFKVMASTVGWRADVVK